MKRKVLTLNECLELERPLTLQEAVDLPLDVYKEYLYHRGILRYLPEKLEEYITENKYEYIAENDKDNDTDYDPSIDIVLDLKGFEFDLDDFKLQENEENDDIEYEQIDEDCDLYIDITEPIIYVNDQEFNYMIDKNIDEKCVRIYSYTNTDEVITHYIGGILYE